MPAYTYTPEQALQVLASKNLTPELVKELLSTQSLKSVALAYKIGHIRLSACAHALNLYTSTKNEKIGSRVKAAGDRARQQREASAEEQPDELIAELQQYALTSVARKRMLDEDWLRAFAAKHSLTPLSTEESAIRTGLRRQKETDNLLLTEHQEALLTRLKEDASLNSLAEEFNTSKRILNRLIPQIYPEYFHEVQQQARLKRYSQEGRTKTGEIVSQKLLNEVKEKYQNCFPTREALENYLYQELHSCIDIAELLELSPSNSALNGVLEEAYSLFCDHSSHSDLRAGQHLLSQTIQWDAPEYNWWVDISEEYPVSIPEHFSQHPYIYVVLETKRSAERLQWLIDRYKITNHKDLSRYIPGFTYGTVFSSAINASVDQELQFFPSASEVRLSELTTFFISPAGKAKAEEVAEKAPTLSAYWQELEVTQTEGCWLVREGLLPRRRFRMSTFEARVKAELDKLEVAYIQHATSILPNRREELDFYLPEYNLAIEVNPTYTHNSTYGWGYKTENAISSTYHQKKVASARAAGITLIMLYEKDLTEPNFSTITAPFLKFKILGADQVFYGRDVQVARMVTRTEVQTARAFLSQYHSQGASRANHYYGFFTKATGDLLGVGSFTENTYIISGEPHAELKRLAFRPGVQVRFGLSKLVAQFFRDFGDQYQTLFSYSRNDMGSGQAYQQSGFVSVRETAPTLTYVNPADPYDTYSWAINSPWSATSGVLSKHFTPEQIAEHDRETLITKMLPRRTGQGFGYVAVYNSGNHLWRYERPGQ